MRVLNKKFLGYCLRYLRKNVFKNYNFNFPESIQIQTVSLCNGRCNFCPYPEVSANLTQGSMSDALFKGIIEEIRGHNLAVIYPYLMNEPLLDKGIFDKVKYIKSRAPSLPVVLNTNGLLLTDDVARLMLDSGLDTLVVSLNAYSKENYEKMMGISYDRVYSNLENTLTFLNRKKAGPNIMISIVRTMDNDDDIKGLIDFCRKRGLKFFINDVENRGGNLSGFNSLKPEENKNNRSLKSCLRPLVQAYVLYNGDMILCCADWRRKIVLGNIQESGSIKAVWNSSRARALREMIKKREFHKISICSVCTFRDNCNI